MILFTSTEFTSIYHSKSFSEDPKNIVINYLTRVESRLKRLKMAKLTDCGHKTTFLFKSKLRKQMIYSNLVVGSQRKLMESLVSKLNVNS